MSAFLHRGLLFLCRPLRFLFLLHSVLLPIRSFLCADGSGLCRNFSFFFYIWFFYYVFDAPLPALGFYVMTPQIYPLKLRFYIVPGQLLFFYLAGFGFFRTQHECCTYYYVHTFVQIDKIHVDCAA